MKNENRTINGTTYSVTVMDALSALSVQTKLMRILGGSFAELSGGANQEAIQRAITKLTENVDDTNVTSLISKLFERNVFAVEVVNSTEVKKPIDMSSYFAGKTADLWQVVFFILEVNFSDIMGKLGLSSIFQEVTQKKES